MSRRRVFRAPPQESEGGGGDWVMTYGDLMTLLLVFFVLIVSFSTLDVVKYRELVGSLEEAFGSKNRPATPLIQEDTPPFTMPVQMDAFPTQAETDVRETERVKVEEDLAKLIEEMGPGAPLELVESPEGLRLRMQGHVIFSLASAELNEDSLPILAELAPILQRYPYRIWVEGHSDDLPIQTPVYPSNWELSAARAGTVVRHMIEHSGLRRDRLAAVGYADTRPVIPNTDEASRAANRRVEMLLSQPGGR